MTTSFVGYHELNAWQASYELAKRVYALSKTLPCDERYGLVTQIRRAAVSIPSNIAEGYRRPHTGSQLQFAGIAFGSASELETQLSLIRDLQIADADMIVSAMEKLQEVLRLLNGYCTYLGRKHTQKQE